jgi:FlaA1/EpsC-like NDP-sugar epimerase
MTFAGRSVLVTGAGGSIGSELCRLVVSQDAKRLVLVSLTEAGLYTITKRLEHEYRKYRDTEIVPLLGDCGDPLLMQEALAGVDVVVHAAAHKHVPICERNATEAISNNVFGTRTMIEEAERAGVEQFCLISSDKAVNPACVMGATKRVAELLIAAKLSQRTQYFTVRFGNVLDSAGSVLPLWREQIAAGGPLTLTDSRCTRYFMSIAQAVGLVAETIRLRPAAGTFVLDMGEPVSMLSLAERTIEQYARGKSIEIKTTGLRPGEKLTEELYYGGELRGTGVERLFRVEEPPCPLDMGCLDQLRSFVSHRRHDLARQTLMDLVR